MFPVLRRISIRKTANEKGKSICIILAVFLTAILFIVVFSTVFFFKDALEEVLRDSAGWMGDAAFIATDEEAQKIADSNLVSDSAYGFHIGETMDSGAYIELVSYEEKMAYWMECHPAQGRMPEKDHEIVVSDIYLENHNLQYRENEVIDVSYLVDGAEYTDSFTLVGMYKRDIRSVVGNVMLLSDDFYDEVSLRLQEEGKDSRDIMYKLVEVIYHPSSDIEKTTYQLMDEVGFDAENGNFTMNAANFSLEDIVGIGAYVVLAFFIGLVMVMGYLFISNIFSLSISHDVRFYGRLVTNGVSASEIGKMLLLGNSILFLIAIIPALAVGYLFTSSTLPTILSSFVTFQVKNKSNLSIFIWACVFSYLTLVLSAKKSIKAAKTASPMAMKRYVDRFKPVKDNNNRNCLNKFVMRGFHNEKKKVWRIYISIAISILLANLFYTIVAGFQEEEYISSNMETDYTVASKSFYSYFNDNQRETVSSDALSGCSGLPGLTASGGGGCTGINILLNDAQEKEYNEIVGDNNWNEREPGTMYTYVYGLDGIMVQKMTVLEGEINLEKYHTGQYVIVDTFYGSGIGDEKSTCFHVGDSITIPFQSGTEKTYTVMAVAELPYNISFQSKQMASVDLFLPFPEWSGCTQIKDYYMYTYDVEAKYREKWDDALSSIVSSNTSLTYQSAKTLADDSRETINEIKLLGFMLSAILLCMGIMNFINCMANSVYSRRKELAIIQSMGTTRTEIIVLLAKEASVYMAGGIILGCIISPLGTYFAVDGFLAPYCVHYGFYPFIYLLFSFIGLLAVILVPWISYVYMDKKEPFLFRIRSCKE